MGTGNGCYGCGGVPVATPYPVPTRVNTNTNVAPVGAPGPVAYGGVVDADPITPGIQSRPGVVTPVGPPRVVGGPGVGAPGARPGGYYGTPVVRPF